MRNQLSKETRRDSLWDFMSDMDHAFESFWNSPTRAHVDQPTFTPAVDLTELDDSYIVSMDLPGLSEKDIKIDVRDGRLTVSGERTHENRNEGKGFSRVERVHGKFERAFQLPNEVNSDQVQAAYENGVLEILIPKKEVSKPRNIQVEAKKGGLFSRLVGNKNANKETTKQETH